MVQASFIVTHALMPLAALSPGILIMPHVAAMVMQWQLPHRARGLAGSPVALGMPLPLLRV